MSSPTSRVDRGGDGSDRQNLAAGEINGDGQGTTMITTTRRIDWWHKSHRLLHNPSSALAMADIAARRCYAGKTRPVDHKPKAWKGSVAHPDHDRAKSKTGGVTETLVDVHSDPGGTDNDDGGEPVTVMDKLAK